MKCNFQEVADVRDLRLEGGRTARNSAIRKMREPSAGRIVVRAHFTIADHLRVQQQKRTARARALVCGRMPPRHRVKRLGAS